MSTFDQRRRPHRRASNHEGEQDLPPLYAPVPPERKRDKSDCLYYPLHLDEAAKLGRAAVCPTDCLNYKPVCPRCGGIVVDGKAHGFCG